MKPLVLRLIQIALLGASSGLLYLLANKGRPMGEVHGTGILNFAHILARNTDRQVVVAVIVEVAGRDG